MHPGRREEGNKNQTDKGSNPFGATISPCSLSWENGLGFLINISNKLSHSKKKRNTEINFKIPKSCNKKSFKN
jgi:hypothetical protein